MSGNGSAETCRLCGGQTTRLWSLEVLRAHVTQAGVDFNGQGIFEMPGSQVRYLTVPAYDHVRNAVILKGIV